MVKENAMKKTKLPPFVAIGADELGDDVGEMALCRVCGKEHPVQYGDRILPDGTKEPSKMLAFYKCPKSKMSYLHGIDGKVWK
jgi:hypothetical protein